MRAGTTIDGRPVHLRPAAHLEPGDQVCLPGGLIRTVEAVRPLEGFEPRLLTVTYAEGRTPDWGPGNSTAPHTLWKVIA